MRFAVQVRGHNFLVSLDGELDIRPHGFLTQIDVESADETGAEDAAIQLLRQSPKLRDIVRNTPDNPPRMFVERIGKYEPGPMPPLTVAPSLIWFPEDGDDSDASDPA
jgi:hypothetical protein